MKEYDADLADVEERIRQFSVVARCHIKHKARGRKLLGIAANDFGLTREEYFRAYSRAAADLDKISRLDTMRRKRIRN